MTPSHPIREENAKNGEKYKEPGSVERTIIEPPSFKPYNRLSRTRTQSLTNLLDTNPVPRTTQSPNPELGPHIHSISAVIDSSDPINEYSDPGNLPSSEDDIVDESQTHTPKGQNEPKLHTHQDTYPISVESTQPILDWGELDELEKRSNKGKGRAHSFDIQSSFLEKENHAYPPNQHFSPLTSQGSIEMDNEKYFQVPSFITNPPPLIRRSTAAYAAIGSLNRWHDEAELEHKYLDCAFVTFEPLLTFTNECLHNAINDPNVPRHYIKSHVQELKRLFNSVYDDLEHSEQGIDRETAIYVEDSGSRNTEETPPILGASIANASHAKNSTPKDNRNPSGTDAIMQQLLAMNQDINAKFAAVNERINSLSRSTGSETRGRQGSRQRSNTRTQAPLATNVVAGSIPNEGQASNPNAPPPPPKNVTFASVAAPAPLTPLPAGILAVPGPVKRDTLKTKPQPNTTEVRFVFRFQGHPLADNQKEPPNVIKTKIDSVLSRHSGTNTSKLLFAKWNANGNLILAFPPTANATAIKSIEEPLKTVLKFPRIAILSRDTSWSKIMISGVHTNVRVSTSTNGISKEEGNKSIYSEETLLNELKASNPIFNKIVITQNPRWVVKPETVFKALSSISVAFEDSDGSVLQSLKKNAFYMFGSIVTIRPWNDRPLLKACHKCLSYDHAHEGCRRSTRCGFCAGSHATDNHRNKCDKCSKGGTELDAPCPHAPKCGSCKGPHPFNDESCPDKAKYRVPLAVIMRRSVNMDLA